MAVEFAAVAAHLERVRERIAEAARRAGRKPEEVTLVAVTKTFPAEAIRAAYDAGVRHFGENRVQEREAKEEQVADLEAIWHLVGHLQSNKAARAARLFQAIDSVDSLPLAQKLDRAAASEGNRVLPILIEVRLDPAETKSGADEAELPKLAEQILRMPHLELRGLMCVPPFFEDPELVRPHFHKLRELRDALAASLGRRLTELSMGMSHDFEMAIEEGATQIRLGTALFGPRSAP